MNPDINRLQTALAEELECFGQFCLLLQREREALASQDHTALEQLVVDKAKVYERLNQLSTARQTALGTGLPEPSRQKFRALDPKLADSWDKLLLLAKEAHELNLINGRIIELQLAQNRNAANLLKNLKEASTLYTASGQTQSVAPGRDLGSV